MANTNAIFTPEELLIHWQGHRNLTRKLIELFPEKELFEFSIGGMRTFAQLATEMLSMCGPGLKAIVEESSIAYSEEGIQISTKADLLQKWDEETAVINHYFNLLPVSRFAETFNLFGQYAFPVIQNIFYFIDNEIHHRGQGYVYLRALNINPPFFWER
ncbi:damage-inducible protein DinB [Taibaiella sp. KBW10]|uniref:DinB family protein n=1 Tax=Taibaiella sp. KBW10 TaxID=2153357 RepID=UPI000F5A2B14|nr:DinB family protein [Taibaiella sp. KBW10]RQO32347.1 damage-inducible protein DinB [Taibaiella sp. KBW10]